MSIDAHSHTDLWGMLAIPIETAHDTVQAKSLLIGCVSCREEGRHLMVAVYLQQGIGIVCMVNLIDHGNNTHGLLFLHRDGKKPSALAVISEIEQHFQGISAQCPSFSREPEHLRHQ